jgi:hypothetical protein
MIAITTSSSISVNARRLRRERIMTKYLSQQDKNDGSTQPTARQPPPDDPVDP